MSEVIQVRDHLVESLRRELIGPDPGPPLVQWAGPGSSLNGQEVLRPQDRPKVRYGAGILFPNGMTYSGLLDAGQDRPDPVGDVGEERGEPEEPAGGETDDEPGDDEVPVLNSFVPSSLGISFLADTRQGLTIEARWATYIPEQLTGWPARPGDDDRLWFRRPASQTLSLSSDGGAALTQHETALGDGAGPHLAIIERPWRDGLRLITVTLINRRSTRSGGDDVDCFFQCELSIRPEGDSRILPYPSRREEDLDDEELKLSLLYRHRPAYAVGHGCAADWVEKDGRIVEVRSETLPVFTQHPILPRDKLAGVDLSMLGIAAASDSELFGICHRLTDAYGKWIETQRTAAEAGGLSAALLRVAGEHLDQCAESLARMRRGIAVLDSDRDALQAFRWMNLAMVQQRSHYGLSADKEKRRRWIETSAGPAPERAFRNPEYPQSVSWRPFQLAFILMNLTGMTGDDDEARAERDLVDVIWFPTGGGKTEAYLGLAAWSMLHRRLVDPANGGVSVLMRYTLRLLTAQQFQRASSLICALELIRRDNVDRLGAEPFSIGLWLGSGVTPNRDADAVTKLAELDAGEGKNPFVVLSCPWCGLEMGRRPLGQSFRVFGYQKVRDPHGSVRLICEDVACPFNNGLPLEVVDERIYRRPPTLLIGTVDKFAMIAWTPEARKLFGIDNGPAGAPDLIIQDELHLISGPLGSMVGHYETLIDELCARDHDGRRVTPKIVASTATIARASEQVRALYARDARLFPPQALRAGDSFFAEECSDIPGRTYVGVLASGLSSHVVAQIRTIAALVQAPANLREKVSAASLDPYWSLVAYFNSLRELGRASTLIQADIREYLNWIWQRTGISDSRGQQVDLRRFINEPVELTSRVPSAEIPEVLEQMFTALPDPGVVDVCFATNMIQVGLDVPRLSLMTIVGQPKGASEYIQASSRVGRDTSKPGLVVTNYNPFKPRDRSHFETFRPYHEAIYRHVEPTSVTPFALPVSERAIHALAVALIRCLEPALRDTPGQGPSEALKDRVRSVILRRIADVADDERDRSGKVLETFFRNWARLQPQRYGDFFNGSPDRPLMVPAGRIWMDGEAPIPRSTPTSMRNVDAESEARLIHVLAGEGD